MAAMWISAFTRSSTNPVEFAEALTAADNATTLDLKFTVLCRFLLLQVTAESVYRWISGGAAGAIEAGWASLYFPVVGKLIFRMRYRSAS